MKYNKTPRLLPALNRLRRYLADYEDQTYFHEYTDEVFIKDVLYGLGIALEPQVYNMADGFEKFCRRLAESIKEPCS